MIQLNLYCALKENWLIKRKIEQASYIFKTNFDSTDSLKAGKLENLSLLPGIDFDPDYDIYWFMPVAFYHNQNKVGRKAFPNNLSHLLIYAPNCSHLS